MEVDCGCRHQTVEEALEHAHKNLGRSLHVPLTGTKTNRMANAGKVIGYQSEDKRVRIRLDFDPVKGLHVNEEDFSGRCTRKVMHRVELPATPMNDEALTAMLRWQENRMLLYWNKWTKRY